VFANWSDLTTAFVVVVATNLAVNVIVGWREGALVVHGVAARFGYRPGEPPEHAKDLWMGIVGQRRGDAERRRRSFVVVSIAVVVTQALPLNGWIAGGLVLGLWVTLNAVVRGYDKVLMRMASSDALENVEDTRDELRQILRVALEPSKTNPLRGRWRALGTVTGTMSVTLAIVGWIGLLSAFGADPRDVPNVLRELLGASAARPMAVAGAVTILLARVPLALARRFALARPNPASTYEIVFLRSFQDDGLKIRARGDSRGLVDRLTMQHRHGYEHLLVASAQPFGPVVAIGQPGESIPPIVAFRRYYEDDEWQGAVHTMLRGAKFIVLSVGDTPSVGWEISKVRGLGLLDRTVFVVPPVDRAARQLRLEILASQLGFHPGLVQPTEPGVECVGVMFEGARPVPLVSAAYDYASYHAAIFEAGFRHFDDSEPSDSANAGRREPSSAGAGPSGDLAQVIPIRAKTAATAAGTLMRGDLATSTVAVLELAAARRAGWPLDTFQILCALIEMDEASWATVLLRTTYVTADNSDVYMDRPADIAGDWEGVPLTAHAAAACRVAAEISATYDLRPLPPGVLALGLVADPSSGASRALLEESDLSHTELADLLQHELLGAGL
jgi:hypothetical protein